jgi:RND family efflux transporter MFP subunit
MATRRLALSVPQADFATALLAERETAPRAKLIANAVVDLLPGTAAAVYVLEHEGEHAHLSVKAVAGELSVSESRVAEEGPLVHAFGSVRAHVLSSAELPRAQWAHLDVRRDVHSLAYIPLRVHQETVGVIEVVGYERELTDTDLGALEGVAEAAAVGLASSLAYEAERHTQLQSIDRLSQLYDLEKVFNGTLDMDALMPIISSKVMDVLKVEAVNLWMIVDEDLVLMHRSGEDNSTYVGKRLKSGEGLPMDVADTGEGMFVDDPHDARLAARNGESGAIRSLMAVPVVSQEFEVAVLEAINKQDGTPFDEDDLFYITQIAETAANALHNASLLEAERKVEILETLVSVSGEITSTLNLDQVMSAVVNRPAAIVPYERAAIALEQKNRIQLRAVSGSDEFNAQDAAMRELRDLLDWCASTNAEVYVNARGDEIDADREETREKFRRYFESTGSRSFYAIPLADDQGRLGILSFESSEPDFLSEAHLELIKVLGSQATVALRNAELYKQVPFIGVLEPLMQKKRRLAGVEQNSRRKALIVACVVAAGLVVIPLPMRVTGNAVVAPLRTAAIQAPFEGVISNVYVREGDKVQPGAVLAELADWDYKSQLAAAEAKLADARASMNKALAAGDGGQAGLQRVQADYWMAEVQRSRERLEQTRLRTTTAGIVATPRVEDLVGKHLEAGELFAKVLDTSRASVDVAIDESDVGLLQVGKSAAVKLETFPTRTFRGPVSIISPSGTVEGDTRVFQARVDLDNVDGSLRSGMQGRGKLSVGWRPFGYVLFRDFGVWIWSKLWSWFGW